MDNRDKIEDMHLKFLIEQELLKPIEASHEIKIESEEELERELTLLFFEKYKERFNLTSIKEVEDKLAEVKETIRKEQEKAYDQER